MTLSERRAAHPYHMHDAIMGQPQAIARVISDERDNVRAVADLVRAASRVHIVGIGTSWHAALIGEYFLRTEAGREDARAWNSFEFCDRPPSLSGDDAVIVLSHRGTKTYSARALEYAHGSEATTALLTGIGSDARRDLANAVVETSLIDPSSAFTISHTSAIAALAMLAVELSSDDSTGLLESLPELVQAAVSTENAVREWAAGSRDVRRFYFVGTGANASTAYEAALKMKEANYTTTEGFHLEQYLHGPFVSTDEGCLVTFVAPPARGSEDRVVDLMKTVTEIGARSAAVLQAGNDARGELVDTVIGVPECPEIFSPIVYLVPLQLLTYWLAVELGHNPDTFGLDNPKFMSARQHYTL